MTPEQQRIVMSAYQSHLNDKLYNAKLIFSDDTFIELQIPEWFAKIDLTHTEDIHRVMNYLRPFTDRRDFKLLKTT